MHPKKLFFCALLIACPLTIYGMKKKSKTVQRLDIDPVRLSADIKEMFLTQAVFGSNLNFDHNDWTRVSQNNPFFLEELKNINYECLSCGTNEPKFTNFCEKYKTSFKSYEDLRKAY